MTSDLAFASIIVVHVLIVLSYARQWLQFRSVK